MTAKQKNKKQDIKDIEAELKILREEIAKKDDFQDNFLRLQAEFDNFKKRSFKEKQEFVKFANEGLILELLGIVDNFERSIRSAEVKKDYDLLHQGVDMISKQLHKLLEEKGLKKISTVGEDFNPHEHEALEVIEDEECKSEKEKVVDELQPGYMMNGRIIRPAKVKVVKRKLKENKEDKNG